jgi:hypothetical protein
VTLGDDPPGKKGGGECGGSWQGQHGGEATSYRHRGGGFGPAPVRTSPFVPTTQQHVEEGADKWTPPCSGCGEYDRWGPQKNFQILK